jgi:outer membrane protein OmpA-like peptidoglycan-associated protein
VDELVMNARKLLLPLLTTSLLTLPALAHAAPPEGEAAAEPEADAEMDAEASIDTNADTDVDTAVDTNVEGPAEPEKKKSKLSKRKDQKWIKRWAPERNMVELGIYGGVLLLAEGHELFGPDLDLPLQGYKPLRRLNPDIGLRVGYYPSRFFGLEVEGGVMPSALRDASGNALLYTARGHLVAQLGLWSITPFVLVGAGGLGVSSPREVLGSDIDPALHFGGGLKFYLSRRAMLRIDVRDIVTHEQSVDATFESHNLEALLGLSLTLGREKDRDEPSDRDGDGFLDNQDSCPDESGVAPDGCPFRDLDTDGDGFLDPDDQCVDQAETVNQFNDEDGCPESDRDGDGFWDDDGAGGVAQDTCPDEAGVAPDGCPIRDADADGILDDVDSCVDQPETKNGFQDADGCPDEIPEAVTKFTGAIKGITFDTNESTIRKSSRPVLDQAVKVLTEYPDVRIEITGHTDSQGDHDHNVDLSQRRAEAVKAYLVDNGIDATRIEAIGRGPDQPIDTNDTKKGRANNRRIEFKILTAE